MEWGEEKKMQTVYFFRAHTLSLFSIPLLFHPVSWTHPGLVRIQGWGTSEAGRGVRERLWVSLAWSLGEVQAERLPREPHSDLSEMVSVILKLDR